MISIEALYDIYLQNPNIQTDTRKLQPGDLFFALKGPHFNANEFVQQALAMGATYAVSDENKSQDPRIIQVDDVLKTLQDLAKFHREKFTIPFIAITGSNGKTTTKELTHAVLSKKFKTYTTEGNLNNHIGIPLTILKIKKDAEMAIVEMGANHQKEIEQYCTYAQPTHGVITNCGKAHLEGFGSEAGVRKGKGELYDWLRANKGVAFAFDDQVYIHEMIQGIPQIIWYGTEKGFVTGNTIKANPWLEIAISQIPGVKKISTQLAGSYNLPNVLCAAAIGKFFDVPGAMIQAAIEGYIPSNSRSQIISRQTNTILLDAYNANPDSMKAAIQNFSGITQGDKIVMLGAMKELGPESLEEHLALVSLLKQYNWKEVVLVGGDFEKITDPAIHYFPTAEEAGKWLQAKNVSHTYILIKGSRLIQMEKILPFISG